MKILFVSPYVPFPLDDGGKIRIFHLLKSLARRYNVTLLSLSDNSNDDKYKKIFHKFCKEVIFVKKKKRHFLYLNKLVRIFIPLPSGILNEGEKSFEKVLNKILYEYKIVHIEEESMFQYFEKFPNIIKVLSLPKIQSYFLREEARYNTNILYKIYQYLESKKYYLFEKRVYKKSDKILVCSDIDKQRIHKIYKGTETAVIPNGVDISYFTKRKSNKSDISKIIFIGSFNYFPNIDASKFFIKNIFTMIVKKNPMIRFLFVGKGSELLKREYNKYPNIEFTGYVDDTRKYMNNSIFIVPLRIGGGTRIKILEAMAMGIPVVSTSIGAEGLEVKNNRDILIADNPRDCAEKVNRLIKDVRLREKLSVNGRKVVEQKYSWQKIGKVLVNEYKKTIEVYKKRVLILSLGDKSHTFTGGAERNLFLVLNALKNKFEFTLVFPKAGRSSEEFKKIGIDVKVLHMRGFLSVFGLIKLIKLIKKNGYNIIQTNDCRANLLGFIASKLTGVGKLIAYRHDVYFNKSYMPKLLVIKKRFYRYIDKIIFKYFEKIIAVSKYISIELQSYMKIPKSKIELIHYGIDIEKYHQLHSKKLDTNKIVIGNIGRIEPIKKGQDVLIRAVSEIRKRFQNIKVLFIGYTKEDETKKRELLKLADKLGVNDNIEFVPYQKDIMTILSKIDIIVYPSLYEGIPISIIESLAAGKPVVASNIEGINELIDNGETGILFKPNNYMQLANRVIYLLSNRRILNKISKNAKIFAKQFNITNNVISLDKVYSTTNIL